MKKTTGTDAEVFSHKNLTTPEKSTAAEKSSVVEKSTNVEESTTVVESTSVEKAEGGELDVESMLKDFSDQLQENL